MPVHGSAHHHAVAGHFVEEDVLLERAEHNEEPPIAKARVSETAWWAKLRVLSEEFAGGFYCAR